MSEEDKRMDPKRLADHQAVDKEGKALAECYRILLEAGAIKPKEGEK